jgi:hypothetical protein
MVDAAGQRWPDGWVRGGGFVRPRGEADPLKAPPRLVDIGEEYVRQIVDVSPGQRKRYLGHLRVLAETRVRGALIFTRPVTSVHESDLKDPNGLVARAGTDRHTQSEPRTPASSSRLRNKGERLCMGGHGLLAGGDELFQMLDAEAHVLADSRAAELALPDCVADPASGHVEVGGCLVDVQQVLLLSGRSAHRVYLRPRACLSLQARASPRIDATDPVVSRTVRQCEPVGEGLAGGASSSRTDPRHSSAQCVWLSVPVTV